MVNRGESGDEVRSCRTSHSRSATIGGAWEAIRRSTTGQVNSRAGATSSPLEGSSDVQCHGTAPECFATARRRDVQVLEGVGGNNGGNRRSKRPESCLRVVPIVLRRGPGPRDNISRWLESLWADSWELWSSAAWLESPVCWRRRHPQTLLCRSEPSHSETLARSING